jgi:hypothetical protein
MSTYASPPRLRNYNNDIRKVGFEVEFGGVDIAKVATAVKKEFGGTITWENPFISKVKDTRIGDFTVEVDADFLKTRHYKEYLEKLNIQLDDNQQESIEKILLEMASVAVPMELVTPPILVTQLNEVEKLENILKTHRAKGTRASLFFGFGMQFNPELPSLNASCLLSYLRAFLILSGWLKEEIKVDFTRRLSPFIDDFPKDYVQLVLSDAYAPDLNEFMDDYLKFNPTRNRPLDLTCVMAYIQPKKVFSAVEDPHLISPRPTLHYRLPDCRIDEEDWSISLEWNRWVRVERLAHDKHALSHFLKASQDTPSGLRGVIDSLEKWFLK